MKSSKRNAARARDEAQRKAAGPPQVTRYAAKGQPWTPPQHRSEDGSDRRR